MTDALTRSKKGTVLDIKRRAEEIEILYSEAAVPLPPNSGLGRLIQNAKDLRAYWFANDIVNLNYEVFFRGLHLVRIAEAILPLRGEKHAVKYLKYLLLDSLDFFERGASRAKNFLWELEVWEDEFMSSILFLMVAALTLVGPEKTAGHLPDEFRWSCGPAVVEARAGGGWDWVSVKDPSIVREGDRWHLFCTVRGPTRSHAIAYSSFPEFGEANRAPRHILSCHPGFFCAPQVLYFTPHKKWYLICQAADEAWGEPAYRPAFSTTTDIADPNSWAKLQPMYDSKPDNVTGWLDFWVICDDAKAHLFYTSLDGKMWRAETSLAEFPKGWSTPQVCLTGDIFEASHTYRLKGMDKYLTLIEAQNGHGWRYFKAYTADRLDGQWQPLAADKDNAFASMRNVTPKGEKWTDVISHGELLRSGRDERLEVDPANLRFLFQGVLDKDRQGTPYGAIPWKLGLLEPAP